PYRGLDVATHQRTSQHQCLGARQSCHGADRVRQLLLAHQRDGVDRDMLAADVVTIGFGYRADRYLTYLRAAAHDDDPLSIDPLKGLHHLYTAHAFELSQIFHEHAWIAGNHHFEIGAGPRRPVVDDLHGRDVALVTRDHTG